MFLSLRFPITYILMVRFDLRKRGGEVGRYEAADGIRGVACLIVLILHSIVILYYGLNGYLVGIPKVGVWLFFVLSAFLLTAKFESGGITAKTILSYVVGRVLRILPLYIGFVFIYWYFGTAGINDSSDVIKSLTLTGSYSHLWTIPVEFKYYALLPFIAFLLMYVKKKRGIATSLATGLVIVLVHQYVWPYWETPFGSPDVFWYISCFVMGSLAAICMSASDKFVTNSRADAVVVLSVFLVFALSPYARFKFFGITPDDYLVNKHVYFGFMCAILVVFLSRGHGVSGALMKKMPLVAVGRWSYPIYLVHWLIIQKIAVFYSGNYIALIASIVLSIAAGGVIHYIIEIPLERFRQYVMRGIVNWNNRRPISAP